MRRRMYALLAAFVLAVLGAAILVQYVRGADQRAQADEALVQVYVVRSDVPAGTSGANLKQSVSLEDVPSRLVSGHALRDPAALDALNSLVTNAALFPGEQLLDSRFADPALVSPTGTVAAPAGYQEVSVTLDAQRAVNGHLAPGDQIGVFVTGPVPDSKTGQSVAGTVARLDNVLVTRVSQVTGTGDGAQTVTVTVAVHSEDAGKLIAGQIQNSVWLSLQVPGPASAAFTTTSSTGANK